MRSPLDHLLACHCGPVLMNRKPAALISQPPAMRQALCSVHRRTGGRLRLLLLLRSGRDDLVFLYNPILLEQALRDRQAQDILVEFGYTRNATLQEMLHHLHTRLREEDFPHEVGLFLGYPPDDVAGFIRHKGEHYKDCCGWKIYGDEGRARRLSAEHRRCRDYLMEQVERGYSVFDLCFPVGRAASGE